MRGSTLQTVTTSLHEPHGSRAHGGQSLPSSAGVNPALGLERDAHASSIITNISPIGHRGNRANSVSKIICDSADVRGNESVKILSDAVKRISCSHGEYADILHRNLEASTTGALEALRLRSSLNTYYDVYTHGQRAWLEDEARAWLSCSLPPILADVDEAVNAAVGGVATSWGRDLCSRSVELEEDEGRNSMNSEVERVSADSIQSEIARLTNACRVRIAGVIADESKSGFGFGRHFLITEASFSNAPTASPFLAGGGGNPSERSMSCALPSFVSDALRQQLCDPMRDCVSRVNSSLQRLVLERLREVLESSTSTEYLPQFADAMESMGSNPNAVRDSLQRIVARCEETLSSIRRGMGDLIGVASGNDSLDVHSEKMCEVVGELGLLSRPRLMRQQSTRELLVLWRDTVDAAWRARAEALGAFRLLHQTEGAPSDFFLQKFSEATGEPLIVLPAGIDAATLPTEAIAALRHAGGSDSNFCMFLDFADLETLLETPHAPPPSTPFWNDLLERYRRMEAQHRGRIVAGGGLSEPEGVPISKRDMAIRQWQKDHPESFSKKNLRTKGEGPRSFTSRPKSRCDFSPKRTLDQQDNARFEDITSTDPFLASLTFGYSRGELAALQELRRLREGNSSPARRGPPGSSIAHRSPFESAAGSALHRIIVAEEGAPSTPSPQRNAPLPTPMRRY